MAQQPDLGMNYVTPLNLANADPREAAISLIKLLMTFLGIIAVVIVLYGGFVWLTAAGNEDRVSTAKKIIVAGVIGLIIILAAFLIVNFVVENVSTALNG
ncbi:MAG: pilin [Planctomycetes bacterium]|nr:pilin [Planctomycetota bacterium]